MDNILCRELPSSNTSPVARSALVRRFSVYGLIVHQRQILLLPQWDAFGLPGGEVELGEQLEEALIREVKEETGLQIAADRLLQVATDFYFDPITRTPYHSLQIFFLASITGGALSADGQDSHEKRVGGTPRWVPIASLDQYRFISPVDHIALLQNALAMTLHRGSR